MDIVGLQINNIIDLGILITVFGLFFSFIGKLIKKSRRDMITDSQSEFLESFRFITIYIIVPILLLYSIINLDYLRRNLFYLLFSAILILIQFLYIIILENLIKVKIDIKLLNFYLFIISFSNMINIYLISKIGIRINNFLFIIISILIGFDIISFIAIKENLNSNKRVKIILSNSKTIYGTIKRMGSEFIELENDKKKIIPLNKSHIVFIENIKDNKL